MKDSSRIWPRKVIHAIQHIRHMLSWYLLFIGQPISLSQSTQLLKFLTPVRISQFVWAPVLRTNVAQVKVTAERKLEIKKDHGKDRLMHTCTSTAWCFEIGSWHLTSRCLVRWQKRNKKKSDGTFESSARLETLETISSNDLVYRSIRRQCCRTNAH